jgi:EpsI family protein
MVANNNARNLKIIFLILLFVIIFVCWFDHKRKNVEVNLSLDSIGMDIGAWHGVNLPSSGREKNWIDQGDLIVRSYIKNDDTVYLVAIQEKGDRHKVHSPQDCYSGAGWVILRKDSISIGDENEKYKIIRRMHVVKENNQRLVYYWFTNGEAISTSFKGHLVIFLKDVLLKGSVKSWVCFQVSTDIKSSVDEADISLKDFIFKLESK